MAGLGRSLATVGSVAVVAAAGIYGSAPASAHASLTAADPPANATLAAGPSRVSATFSEELQPDFAALAVVGPDGRLWSAGEPQVSGTEVSAALRPLGPSGRYTVNYRVTSADGHPVSGSWSFSVTATGTGTPGPAVAGAEGAATRIPWWAFGLAAVVLTVPAVMWGLRRRS